MLRWMRQVCVKGGYIEGSDITAQDISISYRATPEAIEGALCDTCSFTCALHESIYHGCLLWLDNKLWKVVRVVEFFGAYDGIAVTPTHWEVHAREVCEYEPQRAYWMSIND